MNEKIVVESYLAEMLAWELRRQKIISNPDYKNSASGVRAERDEQSRKELSAILGKYLTEKAVSTIGASKMQTMGVGSPPIYDQYVESIEQTIGKSKVLCRSNNGALLGASLKYILIVVNGKWLIHEVYSSYDGSRWRNNAL